MLQFVHLLERVGNAKAAADRAGRDKHPTVEG